ncbi:MAG: MarR family winged helix-turn-helix transcriptional regulator [Clostridia bacterium]|nr:MarR family winged helix-turn-helix transcriptional regulator [Clostridia bacterium]
MEDLFVDFTSSILTLNKIIQKIKTFEIEKLGLKPVHVMCGYYLNKNPQGLTAKELVDLTLEDKAAISRALKIMQKNGYVQYDFNSRNALIKLTDKGKEIALYISEKADKAVMAGSVDFTEDERIFFYNSLGAIVVHLKNYYKELVNGND